MNDVRSRASVIAVAVLLSAAMAADASAQEAHYMSRQQTGLAISDRTGVIAFGSTAIGWQVASSDFIVVSFAICTTASR